MGTPLSKADLLAANGADIGSTAPFTKILRAAAKFSPAQVMSSPITPVQGTAAANSTVTGATGSTTNLNGGMVNPNDARLEPIGTPAWIIDPTSPTFGYVPNTSYKGGASNTPNTAGAGLRFGHFGQMFDICIFSSGALLPYVVVYVTDMSTGIRQRAFAADFTVDNNFRYYKFDFGAQGNRIIEIYTPGDGSWVRSLNYDGVIYRAPASDAPRIAGIGDSYFQHRLSMSSGNGNPLKLSVLDWIGERLGAPNIISLGRSGTGYLNDNSGIGTYRTRMTAGDIDVSKIGVLDGLLLYGSVNDNTFATDAQVQAEVALTASLARQKQSTALIVVIGPQFTTNANTPQSRYDATKAAVASVADSRMLYIDNSPAGLNQMPSSILSSILGPDNTHPTDVGAKYLGLRIGQDIVTAIQTAMAAGTLV